MASKAPTPRLSEADLAKPRGQRQNPFRYPADDQFAPGRNLLESLNVRVAISEVLRGIQNMVLGLARKEAMRTNKGHDRAHIEDLSQEVLLHLSQKSLPQYDAHRKVKVSSFCHGCARQYLSSLRRHEQVVFRRQTQIRSVHGLSKKHADLIRELRTGHRKPNSPNDPALVARDQKYDRKIEQIAADVRAHPERYLSRAQARAYRMELANPGMSQIELSKQLGYGNPTSLSSIRGHIHDRIAKIDIAEWQPAKAKNAGAK